MFVVDEYRCQPPLEPTIVVKPCDDHPYNVWQRLLDQFHCHFTLFASTHSHANARPTAAAAQNVGKMETELETSIFCRCTPNDVGKGYMGRVHRLCAVAW